MPSKKKKYNARFPPARIKKIMQSDEEVGKVAQVVPIIISKSLEIFVEQLLQSSAEVTRSRNARTLTPTHIKTSILQKPEFGFLREIAQGIPDVSSALEEAGDADPDAGPVDFSIRSHNNTTEPPSRISAATTRPTPSSSSGVLNLSNAGGAGTPPIQQGPRPRGRPRKPRPGDANYSPLVIPSTATAPSSSHPLPPKKNAAGRLNYFNSSPGAMVTPSSTPLFGTSPSTSSGSGGSSLNALTSVISLAGGNSNLPQVQPPSIHQYPQTATASAASQRNNASASAATKRKTFSSDQDSDYDNNGDGYGDDDDDESTEEDYDAEEDGGNGGGAAPLRKSAKLAAATTANSQQQRASVLVANPSIAKLPPPLPITSTVTSNDEDDDYDNC
ncbi:PREDICTED: cell wall protein RBR3-like [Rhagoletis zephyria]|uniref:cell wall protein RBR3-like n=1 Tax=Rhagoletis zephyria TaxID=28612 RepID=UPI0008115CB7|nr:PREDICTED: cell wall protein RBR3-like [Rhagoletis zephyria]KAH9404858.1 DR1-associated protein 1 (negative cofactor 2 alpha) [Tyrophagus putrescentiae]